ncbi:MAG: hydroxymethylbilane synthase [Firmicutes bacterium]|nr:hydroxymethylbilane synthase [Bacillota bacterium]
MRTIRIGTRQSALALAQAQMVQAALSRHGYRVELYPMTTAGDRMDQAMGRLEGQGWFTGELERALVEGRIDLAVHSLKDVPTRLAEGMAILAYSEREDPADAFVPRIAGRRLDDLGPHPKVATASVRRACWLKAHLSGVEVVPVRGNVPTRLAKLEAADWDGLILAAAGLVRLGLAERIGERLDPRHWVPAPGQGILAVEGRADDMFLREALAASVHHPGMAKVATAERAVLTALGGGCELPLGAYAWIDGGVLHLVAALGNLTGQVQREEEAAPLVGDGEGLGLRVGERLRRWREAG